MSGPDRSAASVLVQRLLGAAVLFGGLFLLSLLLPQAPPPGTDDASADRGTRRVQIDLTPAPVPPPSPAVDDAVAAAAAPQQDEPDEPARTEPDPVSPPAEATTTAPAPSQPAQPAPTAPPAAARSAPPAADSPDSRRPVSAGWWVQVASFGQPANADGLVDRLKGRGLPARAEQVDISGRKLYRVLVGPYKNQTAADAARGQVILLGFSDSRSVQR